MFKVIIGFYTDPGLSGSFSVSRPGTREPDRSGPRKVRNKTKGERRASLTDATGGAKG